MRWVVVCCSVLCVGWSCVSCVVCRVGCVSGWMCVMLAVVVVKVCAVYCGVESCHGFFNCLGTSPFLPVSEWWVAFGIEPGF